MQWRCTISRADAVLRRGRLAAASLARTVKRIPTSSTIWIRPSFHLRTQRNGPDCTLLSAAAVEFLTQAAASTIDDGADMPAFTGIALPDQVRQRFVHRRAIGHSHQVPAPNRLDRRRLGLLAVPLPAPLFY
jgi:hypothetical protein